MGRAGYLSNADLSAYFDNTARREMKIANYIFIFIRHD